MQVMRLDVICILDKNTFKIALYNIFLIIFRFSFVLIPIVPSVAIPTFI